MKAMNFENINFGYQKESLVFKNLSFSLQKKEASKGHIIAMMGASGSGKSTLLKLILGIIQPDAGKIFSTPQKPNLSYLPQEAILFEHLSPLENARYFENISAYKKYFNNELFEHLSNLLGIKQLLLSANSVERLSGGEKQRIALLRALSIKPDILLLDEPTSGLDADVKLQFLLELRRIVLEYNVLAIYVTHHKIEAELIADEIAYLYKNANDSASEIYQNDILTFIQNPPVLEAVKVFNYPNPNILQCKWRNGSLIPTLEVDSDFIFINVEQKNIIYSNTTGFLYTIISSNPVFTVLEIESGQYLTVNTNTVAVGLPKIALTNTVKMYGPDRKLIKFLTLTNN